LSDSKKYYIFGVFSDKEYDRIIEITAPLAEHIFTVETPDNPRALPAAKLAEAVRRINPQVEAAQDIPDAVRKAFEQAQEDDVIVVFGSLSFLSKAEDAVNVCAGKRSEQRSAE
jgi:dihydrofolate synthase/folylpolyglutamate synthase